MIPNPKKIKGFRTEARRHESCRAVNPAIWHEEPVLDQQATPC